MQEKKTITAYKKGLREVILETAMKAFQEKGIRAVKMDDIAEKLAISKRTMYEIYATKEELLCNGRTLEDYFPNKLHEQLIKDPLVLLERENQFDIAANINGGGPSGQAGALRLAIARALNEYNPEERGQLKKAGFLTRDARAVERKKAGLHKARRAPQYSKR